MALTMPVMQLIMWLVDAGMDLAKALIHVGNLTDEEVEAELADTRKRRKSAIEELKTH